MGIDLVAVVVDDYEPAIEFFVGALGFELVSQFPDQGERLGRLENG